MFGFLKDKLKTAVEKVSKKVEAYEDTDVVEQTKEEKAEEEREKKEKEELVKKTRETIEEESLEEEIQNKGFLKKVTERVTTKKISEQNFEEIFQEFQIVLLENNVALEVVDKIKEDLKQALIEKNLRRTQISEQIKEALKKSLKEILTPPEFNLNNIISNAREESRPAVILIIGYNGAGKSLSSAKLANYFKQKGLKPVLAAADTFRAAGASQLVEYGNSAGIPVIHKPETKDSCSVIFDTIAHAKAKNLDLVIADTSGRIQNNQNLMDELKKISRVNNPDATFLVVDSLTGSDVVTQVDEFDKHIAVDGLILTKADVDEKGGAFLSAIYVSKKPVLFTCSGQRLTDIQEYNPEKVLEQLGL